MGQTKSPVTVVGLGPMGSALAAAFTKAGHRTTVWNRTPGKAEAIDGAVEAPTIEEAVAASPLAVVCLINNAAVLSTLDTARTELAGRTVVNLTSGSPEQARSVARWAEEGGVDYLDGAILTPTPSIGGPSAAILYSGPETTYEKSRETLASLGGTASHLGEDPGRAAAYDVALLDLFWNCVGGIVHSFALGRAEGIKASELAPFAKPISSMLPGMIEGFAQRIDAGEHPGDRSTIASAASAIDHILDTANAHGLDVGVLTASQNVLNRAVEAGYGSHGLSRLTEVLARPSSADQ